MMKAILLLSCFALNARAAGEVLTLQAAIRTALEKNPTLNMSRERVNQSESQLPVARATLLPTLDAVGTATEQKDAANVPAPRFGGERYNAYAAGLRLKQPLFRVGSWAALNVVRKDIGISRLNSEISSRDLTNQVIGAYFQVIYATHNLETLEKQERIVTETLKAANQRVRTGRGRQLDVLQVRTQIALLSARITDARSQLQITAITLANLIGQPELTEIRVRPQLEAPDLKVIDASLDLKKFRFLEMERNELALSRIDDQRRVVLGEFFPRLDLAASYDFTSFQKSELFDASTNSWNVGLTLTIPLFSGFSSLYSQRGLSSQRLQTEFERTNIRNQTNLNQVSSRKRLEAAYQIIVSGEEALRLAEASSNEARRNYQFATIEFTQFLTVQQALVEAESSLNENKFKYVEALAAYFSATGLNMDLLVSLLERAS